MHMRSVLDKLGLVLCVAAAAICLVLHAATFLTIVSLIWIVPPFLLVAGAVLCSRAVDPGPQFAFRFDKVAMLGWFLLIYSICTFVYDYKTTGAATSVAIVDGQYVSKYKDQVIRVITENEYRMFPNLWTRVMSAWIAMTAVFCAKSFTLPSYLRRGVSANACFRQ
jgi:hypothetical protein